MDSSEVSDFRYSQNPCEQFALGDSQSSEGRADEAMEPDWVDVSLGMYGAE
jgi:hypothetical protein